MDDAKEVSISDRTKLTVGVVAMIVGFGTWLTTIYIQGQANASEISEIKSKMDRIEALEIDIAVIKQDVKTIDKKIDKL